MDEKKDQTIVLTAFGRAQDVLREYVEPGPHDAERSISRLLGILDDEDVVKAHERLVWKHHKRR